MPNVKPKAKAKQRRPILLMPSFERQEVATLKALIRARLKRAEKHIKAKRVAEASRDVHAAEQMADLHSAAMYRSV